MNDRLQEKMETRDGDEINDFMMMWLTIVDVIYSSYDCFLSYAAYAKPAK